MFDDVGAESPSSAASGPGSDLLDPRRWYALGLLCMAFFVVVLGSTIVFTAAPSIREDLGFSAIGVQWVFTAQALTFGGLLLFGGRMADRLGRRRMFMAGIALFVLSSLACGLSWSASALIVARAIQGASAAIMAPAALSLVMTTFDEGAERNKALAAWGAIGGTGATAGLLVGGLITDGLGWSWVFFVNVPVGIGMLVVSPFLLKESRDPDRKRALDLAGAATITAALVLLVFAMTQAPEAGWASGQTIGMFTASAMLIAMFVAIELRAVAPMLPPRLFRSRMLVGGNLVMVAAGMAVDGMLFIVTLYAQEILGYSALQFGLAMTTMTVTSIVGSYAAQHVVTRTGAKPVAAVGMALIAVSCILLTRVSIDGNYLRDLFIGLMVFGLGMGAAFVAGTIAALTGISEHDSGVASGLQNTSFSVGTALGVAVLSTAAVARTNEVVAASGGQAPSAFALTEGYQFAFTTAIVVAALGLVAALALLNRPQVDMSTSKESEPAHD
jgi:EmrB/QacA subfamily drug resistance transporter